MNMTHINCVVCSGYTWKGRYLWSSVATVFLKWHFRVRPATGSHVQRRRGSAVGDGHHTHTHNRLRPLVRDNPGRPVPQETHPSEHQTSFIIFLHLQRSMASSLFILRAWQSSRTTSLQVQVIINKPTSVELCISPVYRRLAVAKFSKSTM